MVNIFLHMADLMDWKSGGLKEWSVLIQKKIRYDVIVDTGFRWHFTSFYGPSDRREKYLIYGEVADLRLPTRLPWLIASDFNRYISKDKIGGNRFN